MRNLGGPLATLVVGAFLLMVAASSQAQDPTPVRGSYGATYANHDVVRARVSGSHHMSDDGSNLSLLDVGNDVMLKAKVGRTLLLAGVYGTSTGAVAIATSSAPAWDVSTPPGGLFHTGASWPADASTASCTAWTIHAFDWDTKTFQPLW